MKYKKITNREAVELFLRGDSKLRIGTGLCGPVPVSPETLAKDFADGSRREFYVEVEPIKASFDTVLTYVFGSKTLRDFDIRVFNPFSVGTKVRVTIEEVVG